MFILINLTHELCLVVTYISSTKINNNNKKLSKRTINSHCHIKRTSDCFIPPGTIYLNCHKYIIIYLIIFDKCNILRNSSATKQETQCLALGIHPNMVIANMVIGIFLKRKSRKTQLRKYKTIKRITALEKRTYIAIMKKLAVTLSEPKIKYLL